MTKALRVCIAALTVLAAILASPVGAPGAESESDRAILILAPSLKWQDIDPELTPTLYRLADQGAVGNINARSRARGAGEDPSPVEGALTLSSGVWTLPNPAAPAAYDYDEVYEFDTAGQAFQRATGESAENNRIVYLGMPATQRFNDARSFEVQLGALGQAIIDAGGSTAAIGNSDIGFVTGEQRLVRPAALVAMDQIGRVRFGTVAENLLIEDADAPFGFRTDLSKVETELRRASDAIDEAGGPALVVLDPGDPIRASRFAPLVVDDVADAQREAAVHTIDKLAEIAVERLPDDGTIIVASQPLGELERVSPEGMGPIIVSGPGWSGVLTAPSTQQPGVVTSLDLTATLISMLGAERPPTVLGSPMTSGPSAAPVEERIDRLNAANDAAVALESVKADVINTYVASIILFLLISTVVLLRYRHWRPAVVRAWSRALMGAGLLILSVPLASWLMYLPTRFPRTPGAVLGLFLGSAFIVWVVALIIWRLTSFRPAVMALALGEAALLLADQWLGAPLSFANFLGYSPLPAARFYGLGNEAAALLFGATVSGLALLLDQHPDAPFSAKVRRWGVPLAGVAVVITSALPIFGANVGVAVWGTVGFALFWWLLNGHGLTWRLAVAVAVLSALVLALASVLDLTAGSGAQTHLGRALVGALDGGFGELWTIVVRKAETNLRVLTHTNWSFVLIGVLSFLAFMKLRPAGEFADTLTENPAFSHAITASLIAGLAAFFTEDSGIVIPTLISLYTGVGIVYLMLARLPGLTVVLADRGGSEGGTA